MRYYAVACAAVLAACSSGGETTVVDAAIEDGRFTTLVTALEATGLDQTLRGDGPFTVFAPTDAAFDALPPGTLDALLADPDALSDVLTYHVVRAEVFAADVAALTEAATVQGEAVQIRTVDGVRLNNRANVVITDIETDNGVIHVIDAVILPPSMMSIPDVLDSFSEFGTLLTAVTEAELAATLSGDGPFTLFAPTDAAFAALPDGALDSLLADQAALSNVLLYHVVAANLGSTDVAAAEMLAMANMEMAPITTEGGGVAIDGASITRVDVPAINGVVHFIDAVIIPE